MRHLFLLTALALAGALPPPPTLDEEIRVTGVLHGCDWTPEEVITIVDEVRVMAARSPMTPRDVAACLDRLLTAIKRNKDPIPDVPALLKALGQVVDLQVTARGSLF